ncbi:MAG: cytochrome c [Gammaproteobacteria bacterium]|nr:cytochrome c [Gammaproteobacteria bacterium]
MNTLIPVAIVLFALSAAATGADFDAADYHDKSCTRCHDENVYTRQDRRIQSYPKLEAQVARCDANLGTKLFPDDLQQLTDYLNESYYHFSR